jgi:hypothetical protein
LALGHAVEGDDDATSRGAEAGGEGGEENGVGNEDIGGGEVAEGAEAPEGVEEEVEG